MECDPQSLMASRVLIGGQKKKRQKIKTPRTSHIGNSFFFFFKVEIGNSYYMGYLVLTVFIWSNGILYRDGNFAPTRLDPP